MKYFDRSDAFASLSWLTNKNAVTNFEKEFAKYLGLKYAIGTSFGRTALYLGLKAINAKDTEVIIPSFICTVVRHAVVLAGASPRFVDISYDSLDYNLEALKRAISPKTKAIVVTHYFGNVAPNIDEILLLGKNKDISIIEDCAHSLGAEHNGNKLGTFGSFSIFSLTKNTINYGGGVLATGNESIYLKARSIIEEDMFSIRRTIVDFPITLAYGCEQMIDKLAFDRVGKSMFKWWLIKAPHYVLTLRSFIISLIKLPLALIQPAEKYPAIPVSKHNDFDRTNNYSYPLAMNRLTASVGSSQLKKVEYLNNKRKHIFDSIVKKLRSPRNANSCVMNKEAYSFILLRFKNSNIFSIIKRCKRQGLLLRPTWPTHQKLWDGQDTPSVREIEKTILTWTVNPMLTDSEIQKFIDIINSLPESRQNLRAK